MYKIICKACDFKNDCGAEAWGECTGRFFHKTFIYPPREPRVEPRATETSAIYNCYLVGLTYGARLIMRELDIRPYITITRMFDENRYTKFNGVIYELVPESTGEENGGSLITGIEGDV